MPNMLPTKVGLEIEIENICGVNTDIQKVRENFQRRANCPDWNIKTDGSCGRSGYGVECVSPVLVTEEDLTQVVRACVALRKLGFKATPKCGLHVHLDVSRLDAEQRRRFIQFFVHFENAFYLFDPTRKTNRFCLPLSESIMAMLQAGGSWDSWESRYHWMNGQAFSKHGTCEFRLMGGTIDEEHILGWTNFLLHIYDQTVNHGLDVDCWNKGWNKVVRADDVELLTELVSNANLAGPGTRNERRAQIAREWASRRFRDAQNFQDLARLRAERRARRLDAWSGKKPYMPIFAPHQVPIIEALEPEKSVIND